MKMSFFEKELTIEYITKFIRKKGLASSVNGENGLLFKLYDMNWRLFFEKGRLSMNVNFEIGEDINIPCLLQAINKVNEERYMIKTFMQEFMPEAEDGKPIPNAEVHKVIVFSFETLCFTEKAFMTAYEFCVYALTDSIDAHRKHYAQYLEQTKSKAQDIKIGFNKQDGSNDNTNSTATKDTHCRIGFVQ